jgi:putative ABC transport system substrate-binding protein
MRRREFITFLSGAAAWPLVAHAQQPAKIFRVGLLTSGSVMGSTDERRKNLISALAAQGFVEGQNLILEQHSADAHPARLYNLVKELEAANVDVIVTFGYPAALAAKNSAKAIPAVVTGAGDPVATGLVDGLARPGGHLTGVTELSADLSTKRLEILKDTVPNLRRVAMLWNANDLGMSLRYQSAQTAAGVLGVKVQALGVREPDDFDNAFAEMQREPPDAVLMVNDALTALNRERVVDFASANRLPTIFEVGSIVREGGLMSYGPKQSEIGKSAAYLVAQILRGSRPAGAYPFRVCRQSRDRQGPRPYHPRHCSGSRRRGDRMKGYVCERLAAPSYEVDTERENQSAGLLRDDDVEQHRMRLCIWHHAHF